MVVSSSKVHPIWTYLESKDSNIFNLGNTEAKWGTWPEYTSCLSCILWKLQGTTGFIRGRSECWLLKISNDFIFFLFKLGSCPLLSNFALKSTLHLASEILCFCCDHESWEFILLIPSLFDFLDLDLLVFDIICLFKSISFLLFVWVGIFIDLNHLSPFILSVSRYFLTVGLSTVFIKCCSNINLWLITKLSVESFVLQFCSNTFGELRTASMHSLSIFGCRYLKSLCC